jgi:hypothetical protein
VTGNGQAGWAVMTLAAIRSWQGMRKSWSFPIEAGNMLAKNRAILARADSVSLLAGNPTVETSPTTTASATNFFQTSSDRM